MSGIYILLIELDQAKEIAVGQKRRLNFQKGCYAYVGSALGGLQSRVARHLRTAKKVHWHIDYLLNFASVREVTYVETSEKKECLIAKALSQKLPSVSGFGCSDCSCHSHLFFCSDLEALKNHVRNTFKDLNLNPGVISRASLQGYLQQQET